MKPILRRMPRQHENGVRRPAIIQSLCSCICLSGFGFSSRTKYRSRASLDGVTFAMFLLRWMAEVRRLARTNYPMRGNRTVSDSRSAAMASARLSGTAASAFKVVNANVPLGQGQNELPGWRQDRCTGTCVMP